MVLTKFLLYLLKIMNIMNVPNLFFANWQSDIRNRKALAAMEACSKVDEGNKEEIMALPSLSSRGLTGFGYRLCEDQESSRLCLRSELSR